jgi:hypothetical protein
VECQRLARAAASGKECGTHQVPLSRPLFVKSAAARRRRLVRSRAWAGKSILDGASLRPGCVLASQGF